MYAACDIVVTEGKTQVSAVRIGGATLRGWQTAARAEVWAAHVAAQRSDSDEAMGSRFFRPDSKYVVDGIGAINEHAPGIQQLLNGHNADLWADLRKDVDKGALTAQWGKANMTHNRLAHGKDDIDLVLGNALADASVGEEAICASAAAADVWGVGAVRVPHCDEARYDRSRKVGPRSAKRCRVRPNCPSTS